MTRARPWSRPAPFRSRTRSAARTALVLATALVFAGSRIAAQQPGTPAFDGYVTTAMHAWKVPGLAIAIVRNDSVVFAKGYGVRELGKPAPVDTHTMFAIGSATKAFTATLVGMLVDASALRWDDRATTYLPGFQLHDPYATRELTIRDLLTHRSGLARGDLLWYATDLPSDSILRHVRYLAPTWSFRSHFGYQNIMYLAAGTLAARVAGTSWSDLVRTRIFAPLGMTSTNTSISALTGLSDVASPHADIDDTVRVVPYHDVDNIAPAGAINSDVLDMAQWLRFQLNGGKALGKTLVSAGALEETHTPQTIIDLAGLEKALYPDAHFLSYGMGWFLSDYHGREIVEHGGNIDGMSALVAQLPEEKTGLVILTNMNGTLLTYALMHRVFDAYLHQPPTDWSAKLLATYTALVDQGKAAQAKRDSARVKGTSPSLPLTDYAGTYVDSMYGTATVHADSGRLELRYGTNSAPLEHWQYDTFHARWRNRLLGNSVITFHLDADGKVSDADVEGLADFRRKAAAADTTPGVHLATAELRKYVGTFTSKAPPITVEVQMVGGTLALTVPGQPTYTLVPVTPTRFRLTGPPNMPAGFFLSYTMTGDRVTSVALEQPAPRPQLTLVPEPHPR